MGLSCTGCKPGLPGGPDTILPASRWTYRWVTRDSLYIEGLLEQVP